MFSCPPLRHLFLSLAALLAAASLLGATMPGVVRDQDGDGMEDAWEQGNGLSSANPSDALTDLDGDGAINVVEYWFGTDPQNTASRPALAVDLAAGKPRLRWAGLLNKRYQIEFTTNLVAGSWTSLLDPVVGAGSPLQLTDLVISLPSARFYRVRAIASFDRDGDGLDDWLETVVYGSNPDRGSSSGSGIPDGWAVRYGLSPATVLPTADPDADGAVNLAEYIRGTNPGVGDLPLGDAVALLRVFTPLGY